MANTNHRILMPVNEPTYDTKKKSQILTYLEQNQGPGVQHLALLTNDIFATLKSMRAAAKEGCGFTFQAPPPPTYYQQLKERLGISISQLLCLYSLVMVRYCCCYSRAYLVSPNRRTVETSGRVWCVDWWWQARQYAWLTSSNLHQTFGWSTNYLFWDYTACRMSGSSDERTSAWMWRIWESECCVSL